MDFLKRKLNYLPGYYKDSPAPPPAPDPYAVANAQTQANKDSSAWNAEMNRVNQYTPFGSLTYAQNGTNPDGSPIWQSNINLSPQGQNILNSQLNQDQQLNSIASGMMGQVQNSYNQPLNLSGLPQMVSNNDLMADKNNAINATYQAQTNLLDPRYQQEESQLRANLVNQGIVQGSDAWNNAMGNFSRDKDTAYQQAMNDAVMNGGQEQSRLFSMGQANRQQSLNEMMLARSQPLNELNALRSAGQLQTPQFSNVPQVSMPSTDVAGNIWNAFNSKQNAYNQQVAQNNATTSGLFSLGGSLGSAAMMAML